MPQLTKAPRGEAVCERATSLTCLQFHRQTERKRERETEREREIQRKRERESGGEESEGEERR